ncbi:hypothetical protein D9611_000005 [Ephemerocybe angulata]|uniref:Carbonic anhydrase n=1 Tax=Ephemerocybe angulata TaxID=980116 RepID=A0A8H5BNF7_9AGAR|nr:hypothetical protein D9611_000005 [Tulosesus angulatus]
MFTFTSSGSLLRLLIVVLVCFELGLAATTTNAAASPVQNNTTGSVTGFNTLGSLYDGNKRFRNTAGKRSVVKRLVEEPPSFMFLGCTDNRLTPASIFQAPVGSIITQNNIGNQYSKKDVSTDAAITYAIEDLGVQHIIVLGHYGCKGVSRAITGSKKRSSISEWIAPIANFYKRERRAEVVKFRDSRMPRRGLPKGITDPPSNDDEGYRAFVEENVKQTVKALREDSILAKGYQLGAKTNAKETQHEVYIHGFVFDETTGTVVDLKVSFGPPGKPIPSVPFTAAAAAKNLHTRKASFNKGKILSKPKYIHD